jgi:DNA-binding transcriptional ArsR family regulator
MEKNKLMKDRLAKAARKLKVCGHPMRLRLLCAIENREPCVSDLSLSLEELQPVVSQHLAVLKKEGIVTSKVKGNRRMYTVSDAFIKTLLRALPL